MEQASVKWITVAQTSALPPESVIAVRQDGLDLALYRIGETFYASDNVCPHAYNGRMSRGILEGDTIACPLHGAVFEIKSGRAIDGPYCADLKTFPVRIVGDEIQVEVDSADVIGPA